MTHTDVPSNSRRNFIKMAALVGVGTAAVGASEVYAHAQDSPISQSGRGFRLHDPQALPPSNGYSHVGEVTRGRTIYIAGQVPLNAAGELVGPGDFRAQLEQVFANLDAAVRAAGGTFGDVVKLNYYCVDSIEPAQQRAVVEVRDRYVDTQAPPVSTLVFVSRLVRPEWLVEIEAVAVLPAPSQAVVVIAQLDFDSVETTRKAMDLARKVALRTRAEDGCLHYAYGLDVDVPTRLQLSEWWRDEAALQAHLHSPHLREFRTGLRKLGGSRAATVKRYAVDNVSDLVLPRLDQ